MGDRDGRVVERYHTNKYPKVITPSAREILRGKWHTGGVQPGDLGCKGVVIITSGSWASWWSSPGTRCCSRKSW